MDQAVLNNVIAIIGMLTGLAGFGLSLFVFFRDRIRLNVHHPCRDSSALIGFNLEYVGQDKWGNESYKATGHILVLWLQIANTSSSPTTILELTLRIDGQESILHNKSSELSYLPVTYSVDPNGQFRITSSRACRDIIKPAFRLEPYSAIEGNFVFTNLSYLSKAEYEVQLIVKTTQRSIKTNFIVYPSYPELIEQKPINK